MRIARRPWCREHEHTGEHRRSAGRPYPVRSPSPTLFSSSEQEDAEPLGRVAPDVERGPGGRGQGQDLVHVVLVGVLGVDPVARHEPKHLVRYPPGLARGARASGVTEDVLEAVVSRYSRSFSKIARGRKRRRGVEGKGRKP